MPFRIGRFQLAFCLFPQIAKQCERMYALLAICTTLSPGPSDEGIMGIVKEHYGDQLAVLQRGG
jgi:translation initiation factor 3 subunit L